MTVHAATRTVWDRPRTPPHRPRHPSRNGGGLPPPRRPGCLPLVLTIVAIAAIARRAR